MEDQLILLNKRDFCDEFLIPIEETNRWRFTEVSLPLGENRIAIRIDDTVTMKLDTNQAQGQELVGRILIECA